MHRTDKYSQLSSIIWSRTKWLWVRDPLQSLGFNVIEYLVQNSVLTKDRTVLENIYPSLHSLKIEQVKVIKHRKRALWFCL